MSGRGRPLGAAPLRRQHIEALQRRATAQTGDVRALLEQRLAELMDAAARDVADDVADAPSPDKPGATVVIPPRAAPSPLRTLVEHMKESATRGTTAGASTIAGASLPAASPDLALLDEIRQTCAKVRNQSQLRQALDSAPDDAGPLNSANLVHRALTRMQALSPAYLQYFIAYVDALSALEPFRAPAARAEEKAARGPATSKRAGTRSRKRPT